MSGFKFLSWLRQGLAAKQVGGLVAVKVELDASGAKRAPEVNVSVYGPGDVAGIDRRMIARREPAPRSVGFAPNFLASIEFRRPDFPWMLSRGADAAVAPWLCLAVLDEADAQIGPAPNAPLPVLTVAQAALPHLPHLPAWAHVQVGGDFNADLGTILRTRPQDVVSRIVCPRQLEPNKRYVACLVPTTVAGRKAGLGETVLDSNTSESTAPAWNVTANSTVRLPVYDYWTFQTGAAGDFEAVADRLRPHRITGPLKTWPLDVSSVAGAGTVVAMPAAMAPVPDPSLPSPWTWTGASRTEALNSLSGWLQPAINAATPVVGPPLYGNGITARTGPGVNGVPLWMRELNLDPRYRAVAGLGIRVVRENQEMLVAEAHKVVGAIRQAQRITSGAALATMIAQSSWLKNLASGIAASTTVAARSIAMARPASERVQVDGSSARAKARTSSLGTEVLDPPFRRMLHARTRTAQIGTAIAARATQTRQRNGAPQVSQGTLTFGLIRSRNTTNTPYVLDGVDYQLPAPNTVIPRLTQQWQQQQNQLDAEFRAAVTGMRQRVRILPRLVTLAPLAITSYAQSVVNGLEPRTSAFARVASRVSRTDTASGRSALAPIIVEPSLAVPVGDLLKAIDRRFLAAGVGEVPPDSVTLLDVDKAFVESILVGANHELVRELLWRGIAVDPKATLLAQFWPLGTAARTDIKPLREWARDTSLGSTGAQGSAGTIVVIRSELVQRFPDALISVAPMTAPGVIDADESHYKLPLFRGRAATDIWYLGIPLEASVMRGDSGGFGWSVVIQERPGATRFGFDDAAADNYPTTPSWAELSWKRVPVTRKHVSLVSTTQTQAPRPTQNDGMVWNGNTPGSDMAAISRQRPVRVAIHCSQLLPTPTPRSI